MFNTISSTAGFTVIYPLFISTEYWRSKKIPRVVHFWKCLFRAMEPLKSGLYQSLFNPQPSSSHTKVSKRMVLQTLQHPLNTTPIWSRYFYVIQASSLLNVWVVIEFWLLNVYYYTYFNLLKISYFHNYWFMHFVYNCKCAFSKYIIYLKFYHLYSFLMPLSIFHFVLWGLLRPALLFYFSTRAYKSSPAEGSC